MSGYERPNIQAMQGYVSGEQPDDQLTIKLNTNENPYPPSPKVDEALKNVDAASLRRYPQPTADNLRAAIATLHHITTDQVVVTHGGDEALRLAITTFVNPKSTFGMAEPSYTLYSVLADIHDAHVIRVALTDDWQLPHDFAATLNTANVELACVVNPHAPSGTLLPVAKLAQVASELRGVLLIDEAYANFIDPQHAYASESLLAQHDNVLILRTFSKGYSLAGLRLGYLLGQKGLIEPILAKTRDSYNIDHLSQVIGLASILDQNYAQSTWERVRTQRTTLSNNLAQLGLSSPPSQSNFILVTVPPSAKIDAKQMCQRLQEAGILVRYFETDKLQDKLRISIGTAQENEQLVSQLTKLLT